MLQTPVKAAGQILLHRLEMSSWLIQNTQAENTIQDRTALGAGKESILAIYSVKDWEVRSATTSNMWYCYPAMSVGDKTMIATLHPRSQAHSYLISPAAWQKEEYLWLKFLAGQCSSKSYWSFSIESIDKTRFICSVISNLGLNQLKYKDSVWYQQPFARNSNR